MTPDLSTAPQPHESVMTAEVIDFLNVRPGGHYIDCTVGAGGHSAAILEASAPDGRLLANDADPEAIAIANHLSSYARAVGTEEDFDFSAVLCENDRRI